MAATIQAMIVENARRASLAPLDEARGFAALIELGFNQAQIGEAVGAAQSQVSKRLSLLDLPEPVQIGLAADKITVNDALVFRKLKGGADQLAAWLAVERKLARLEDPSATDRARAVADAVAQQAQAAKFAQREAASRAQAHGEGLRIVDPIAEWGPAGRLRRLDDEAAIARAREAGNLAAALDEVGGLYYVLTVAEPEPETEFPSKPAPEPATLVGAVDGRQSASATPAARTAPSAASVAATATDAEAKERGRADRAREEACARIAIRKPPAAEAAATRIRVPGHAGRHHRGAADGAPVATGGQRRARGRHRRGLRARRVLGRRRRRRPVRARDRVGQRRAAHAPATRRLGRPGHRPRPPAHGRCQPRGHRLRGPPPRQRTDMIATGPTGRSPARPNIPLEYR